MDSYTRQGRTVHLHFKIWMFEGSQTTLEFTSQLYFNDTITDQVYSQPPYSDRGPRDVRNIQEGIFNGASTDGLVQSNAGEHLILNLTQQDLGYLGTFNIGLKLNQRAIECIRWLTLFIFSCFPYCQQEYKSNMRILDLF